MLRLPQIAGQVASQYQLQRSCRNVFHIFSNELQTRYNNPKVFIFLTDYGEPGGII